MTDEPPTDTTLDPGVPWLSGKAAMRSICSLDLIAKSPGLPPTHPLLKAAQHCDIPLTSATNLYIDKVRRVTAAPIIGITGSKGKSTTATMVYRLLRDTGRGVVLAGNIGTPSLDVLDHVLATGCITVLELSSYQCHDLSLGPNDALILSLFPEHMDWHGSVEAYYRDKLKIAEQQGAGDRVFYNGAETELCRRLPLGPGDHIAFNVTGGLHYQDGWFRDAKRPLLTDADMRLPGYHNRINAVAAYAVTRPYGVEPDHLASVISQFEGLPHRLQSLGIYQGIHWFDDSIATAPEATQAGLEAISNVETLIVGGADRGYDFLPLARVILNSGLQDVILIPPGGSVVRKALGVCQKGKSPIKLHEVLNMQEAVSCAARVTRKGQACLLSPASPSYGIYRDFMERGEHFQRLVDELEG
jgi:UDP-N-acetylmuramoylalanine--D-glutamate ligase